MASSASAAASVVSAANKAQTFANQTVENGRFEAIKEPIGFIKIIQFIMAILAFAIAVNGASSLAFTAVCKDSAGATTTSFTVFESKYKYPYNLKKADIYVTQGCPSGQTAPTLERTTLTEEGYNIKSSAEFFVFLGVMAMLYSFGILIVYIFLKHKYDNIVYLPLIDFGVTVVFTICWFASDIAWAKAISDIQHHTNPDNLIESLPKTCISQTTAKSNVCHSKMYASYGSIIISCIIGFCNLILWAALAC